ncbi:DNA (cytosine-5-)-methyltransferase [Ochrobactrum sp. MT180101]|nr:DNA (cytosine-5-)-methyltransferase [Ochrobactrum sp. MT180101]
MIKPRVLDLFSGIGGFSLGLERTGGFETVAFCEIEEFPRRVLAKHWPEVPCYHDVRELTADKLAADGIAVDVITGGVPCQDISLAGRMQGIEGRKSGLWEEYFKLIETIKPKFVIIENSPVLRSRGLEGMLSQFSEIGYAAEWHCIPVNAIGAPHRRDRVWIIAHPAGVRDGLSESQILTGRNISQHGAWWSREPQICRVDDGTAGRVDRLRSLGNAVVPQIPEIIGRAILATHPTGGDRHGE